MIQMIIGENWNNISEAKKEELTEVFEQYITSNYLKKCLEKFQTLLLNKVLKKKLVKITD